MLELIKLIVDGLILRRAHKQGIMSWKVYAFAILFVIVLYATGVPAAILYQDHPQYKPLFFAAIVFDAVLFLLFIVFGFRWYFRAMARLRARQAAAPTTGTLPS
jgi:hypothetical protein